MSIRIPINIFDLTLELGVGNVGRWVICDFWDGYPEQLPAGHYPPRWVVPNPDGSRIVDVFVNTQNSRMVDQITNCNLPL